MYKSEAVREEGRVECVQPVREADDASDDSGGVGKTGRGAGDSPGSKRGTGPVRFWFWHSLLSSTTMLVSVTSLAQGCNLHIALP